MRIGRLRHRIIVQHKDETARDELGGIVPAWVATNTLWAEVNPWAMRSELSDRRQAGEAAMAFRVRAPLHVELGDRIVHDGTNYEITGFDPSREQYGEMLIMAKAEDTTG